MTQSSSLVKKASKQDRERNVLLGLIEYYIKTGKPVGSHTLQEDGFGFLSSATLRNYFANLEDEGYLLQHHTSGGRIPTAKAFRLYAHECLEKSLNDSTSFKGFESIKEKETKSINKLLQEAAEQLAFVTKTAVFLSAPRFEQDFIIKIKLIHIESNRYLCALITDFGEVTTELLYTKDLLNKSSTLKMEAYFEWRLNGNKKPDTLTKEEEDNAQALYNELLVRYIVTYSQFDTEEIYRTGFSTLLNYPEFKDLKVLTQTLSFFENTHGMRLLLKECTKLNTLKFWIGDDLHTLDPHSDSTVMAIPYYVNNKAVGAIGLLSPQRVPYAIYFDRLRSISETLSHTLTKNLYKFKIDLKVPKQESLHLNKTQSVTHINPLLIEDLRIEN